MKHLTFVYTQNNDAITNNVRASKMVRGNLQFYDIISLCMRATENKLKSKGIKRNGLLLFAHNRAFVVFGFVRAIYKGLEKPKLSAFL